MTDVAATDAWLGGSIADKLSTDGPDLLARWEPVAKWLDQRLSHDVDPYRKTTIDRVGPQGAVQLRNGRHIAGINFASQDYLGLSSHPAILQAAQDAISTYGVHSAGSAALSGIVAGTGELERELADFLRHADCTTVTTGWGAGYGAIRALVNERDHVVIDVLAHNCLQEGARAATRNIHPARHLSHESVGKRLRTIRQREPDVGILVVTETLFSMDSDTPDLAALVDVCHAHRAVLLVDMAHDFGAVGHDGLGVVGGSSVLESIDVLVGSFSKTLGF